jgi:hypothetical protein
MPVFHTLDQVIRSCVGDWEKPFDHICAGKMRQRRRGVEHHTIARTILVNHLCQEGLPGFAFAASSPNSINRRIASGRVGISA